MDLAECKSLAKNKNKTAPESYKFMEHSNLGLINAYKSYNFT